MTVDTIRLEGIGSNFKVLNPGDGFKGGNRLWFGICASCGERVTNSSLLGIWEHKIPLVASSPNSISWKSVDYCPSNT